MKYNFGQILSKPSYSTWEMNFRYTAAAMATTTWPHVYYSMVNNQRVRISSTFSVLWPFSYLRPFLYFDLFTSTSLLRLAYFNLCTSTFCQIWATYWSRRTDLSTVLVEVKRFWKIQVAANQIFFFKNFVPSSILFSSPNAADHF